MTTEIKPTEGNINLMISIKEIEEMIRKIQALNYNSISVHLKKIGDYSYKISELKESNEVGIFSEYSLLNLLNAPIGLYAMRNKTESITDEDNFRIELKKGELYWTIDTGEKE